jgi:hypothetical protein
MLNKYGAVQHFYISKDASTKEFDDLRNQLKDYNLVINAHFDLSRSASKKIWFDSRKHSVSTKIEC